MQHDRGSSVVIPVIFKDNSDPFVDPDYFDPTSPTITIRDPNGTAKVTTQALTKNAVGKYSYTCQTATNWLAGEYEVEVIAVSGSYTDVTIETNGFILK